MITFIKAIRYHFRDSVTIALITISAILFYLPLFRDLSHGIPCVDWCGVYPYIDFFRISLIKYHQFPLRAPHFGGGYPFIGFPYDISLSPLMLIVLVFGAIEGTKITIFLMALCGALSVFYLTRYLLRYNLLGSFFSSAVFLFCSWGPCQYLESNYEKLYFYLLPLLLVLFIKSIKDKKFIFIASVVLSVVVLSAGGIIIPIAIFLFLFACLNAIQIEKPRKITINIRYPAVFVLIILITVFISMAKILPMQQLLSNKDIKFIHFSYENNYSKICEAMIAQQRDVNPEKLYGWLFRTDSYVVGIPPDDYVQMYFGYIPVILAVLSFIFYWKKIWRYSILLVISIILAFGPHSRLDLFKWLWHLHPYVHSIWRLDEYFTFQIFFIIAVATGRFFSVLDVPRRRLLLWLLIPVMIFSLNNMFWPNRRFLENRIHLRDRSEFSFKKEFSQVTIKNYVGWPEPYQIDQYYYLQSNIGLTDWLFGNLAIKTNIIPRYFVKEGESQYLPSQFDKFKKTYRFYRGEVFFLGEESRAQLQYFSPNKIHVSAQLKNADTLIINQNYHESWRTNVGKIANHKGLLAVVLDGPGDYKIRLTYVPLEFYLGLAVSMVSLLLAYYFLIYKRNYIHGKK